MAYLLLYLYGFLSAAAALLLEVVFGGFPAVSQTWSLLALLGAACIEESSKWVFFRQFRLRFDLGYSKALTAGILFGLGFATTEFLLIFFGLNALVPLALLGILAVHIFTSLTFSYYLFRLAPRTLFQTLSLLLFMIGLHALYNLLLARSI